LLSPQRFRPPSATAKPFERPVSRSVTILSRFNLANRAEYIAGVRFCGLERKVFNEFFLLMNPSLRNYAPSISDTTE